MVGQYGYQLILVLGLKEHLDCAVGELGERLVGRGEDRKRPLSRKSFRQSGRLDSGNEGAKRTSRGRGLDNVLIAVAVHVRACVRGAEGQYRRYQESGHRNVKY